jgi:hypothetical protein
VHVVRRVAGGARALTAADHSRRTGGGKLDVLPEFIRPLFADSLD